MSHKCNSFQIKVQNYFNWAACKLYYVFELIRVGCALSHKSLVFTVLLNKVIIIQFFIKEVTAAALTLKSINWDQKVWPGRLGLGNFKTSVLILLAHC